MQDGDTAVQEKSRKKLLLILRDSNIYLDYEVQLDIIPSLASSRLCPRTQGLLFLLLSNMDFITENILLIITFVGSAILLAFPSLSKSKNSGLSPAEVVIQVNDKDAQLVDVRTSNEFSKGSLAGAVNIPAAAIDFQPCQRELSRLPGNETAFQDVDVGKALALELFEFLLSTSAVLCNENNRAIFI